MKNIKKIIAVLGLSACVALGAVGFTSCQGTVGETGKSAYEIWLDNGYAGSETDFLEWLKGEKGDQGEKGDTGATGKSAYEIWLENGNTGTEEDFLEWLKGACDCEHSGGEITPNEPFSAEISVTANSTYNMPISGISAGVHVIEADLGETKLTTGRLQANIGEITEAGAKSELVFSESRCTDGHNVYYGYIQIAEDDSAITFKAINENVNAIVYIKDWVMPTLTADTPTEMPVNQYGTADENLIKIKLDSSIAVGEYKIFINGDSSISNAVKFFVGTKSVSITVSNYNGNKTISITDDDLSGGEVFIYLIVGGSNNSYRQINPVTVTLTKA